MILKDFEKLTLEILSQCYNAYLVKSELTMPVSGIEQFILILLNPHISELQITR
jgi:hypothetical protein